eukprot:2728638-Pyramimonas_sp.AAC.1
MGPPSWTRSRQSCRFFGPEANQYQQTSFQCICQVDCGRSPSSSKSGIPCRPPAGGADTLQARYLTDFTAATA